MAIPPKPTLTTPPAEPVRGEDETVFANKAKAYVSWIGTNVTDLTAAIDWQNTVFKATADEAKAAALEAINPPAENYSPADAATATLDISLSNTHRITMPAGNITVAVLNVINAQKFLIEITQDATGSRTVTWFATIKWVGGAVPTLTTTANKRDTFGFERTGADTYDGYIVGQNI